MSDINENSINLSIEERIASLESYFHGSRRPRISYRGRGVQIPLIPTGELGGKLNKIAQIEEDVSIIYYDHNLIEVIENLSEELVELYISYNLLFKIENIPASLQVLDVSYNHNIHILENLPLSLRRIYYDGCPIKWVDGVLYSDIRFTLEGYHAIIRIQKRIRRRLANKYKYVEVIR